GYPLQLINISTPNNGIAIINGNQITYTSTGYFFGTDTLTYIVSDGFLTNTGTIDINVLNSFDPPIATDGTYITNEDTTITGNFITDDTGYGVDISPDTGNIYLHAVTPPAFGNFTANATGAFTYTPPFNFDGLLPFTYIISDGRRTSIGNYQFGPTPTTEIGTGTANYLAFADFDLDGDLDAFIARRNNLADEIWLNQGGLQGGITGTFTTTYSVALGNNDSSIPSLGDIDNDGDIDAIVPNRDTSNAAVWINQGGLQNGTLGTFSPGTPNIASGDSFGGQLTDIDNDGDLDFIVFPYLGDGQVWLNQGGNQGGTLGDFGLAPATTIPGFSNLTLELGDLDNDGDDDIIISHNGGDTDIWLNQGGAQGGTIGTFGTTPFTSLSHPGGAGIYGITLADFDLDNDLDVALTTIQATPNQIWLNQGGLQNGTLATFAQTHTFDNISAFSLDSADIDKDGDLDLLIASNGTEPNKVWFNQGRAQGGTLGTFGPTPAEILTSTISSRNAYLLDLNQDGLLDAAFSRSTANAIFYHYHQVMTGGTEILDPVTSNTAIVTITINAVNDPPIANPDAIYGFYNLPVTIDALANDTDVDNTNLTILSVSTSTLGTVINNGTDITFTGNGTTGTETLTYIITDGILTATSTITVTAVWGQGTLALTPTKDNTIYFDATGNLSNGQGDSLFVGENGFNLETRALLAFDVPSQLPSNAAIITASLRINVDTPSERSLSLNLHRLTGDWGEGASHAPNGEGGGAAAQTGDATWLHQFYNTSSWSTPGGDFAPTVTANYFVPNNGVHTITSPQMITDIENWLTSPATNFGWILVNETGNDRAIRFHSRHNPSPEQRPTLTINYYTLANNAPSATNDTFYPLLNTPNTLTPLANDTDPDNNPLLITQVSSPAWGTIVNLGTHLIYTSTIVGSSETLTYTITDGVLTSTAQIQLFNAVGMNTIDLTPNKDTTIYDNGFGDASNGQGDYFFIGSNGRGEPVRSLIAFDTTTIPSHATILTTTLHLSAQTPRQFSNNLLVYPLLTDWGEGPSNAPDGEGGGTLAEPGDATWTHTFYPTSTWTTAGGDITTTLSAGLAIPVSTGNYQLSTPQLTTDVKNWVANPTTNFGWLLRGSSENPNDTSAIRFVSRHNSDPNSHPRLQITYYTLTNTPPIAINDTFYTTLYNDTTLTPTTNDIDIDGQSLHIINVTTPTLGTATLNNNNIIYHAHTLGQETLTYTISDGFTTTTAQITITNYYQLNQVTLTPIKDNTIYENNNNNSNGLGENLFIGVTSFNSPRRALLAFDLQAAGIPTDAIVLNSELLLTSNTPDLTHSSTVQLGRLTADWGEGTSNASGAEGNGTAATTGDATWAHRFYNTTTWTTNGGDFILNDTLSQNITGHAVHTISTPEMNADLQLWANNPTTNFGWILLGNETVDSNALRFASKDHPDPNSHPYLNFTFASPAPNLPPSANPDTYTTTATIFVAPSTLNNDRDPNNDPLTITSNTSPITGTLDFRPDGTFTFTAPVSFTGIVTFTYTISDGLLTATTLVTINVSAAVDALPPLGLSRSILSA
ncbi:MAG TPA: Ig-like domain-containing protein, partial [Anaerolineae bacterium]|nr:Ig-like domain-containing protein [Anaerolineae bacterium]